MSNRDVRFVIDLRVEEGDVDEVVNAIVDSMKYSGNFVANTAVRESEEISKPRLKIKTTSGAAHVHNPEENNGYCATCGNYAGLQTLIRIK